MASLTIRSMWSTVVIGVALLQSAVEGRNPIILVNGLAGSQIIATLDIPSGHIPHFYCKTKGTETVWSNPLYFISGYSDCYNYYMKLTFDPATGTYTDAPGVTITTKDFGKLSGGLSGYFGGISKALKSKFGYIEGTDLHGIPYDWRLGSEGLAQRGYFKNVQALVEETSLRSGGLPVIFVSHSMGGPVTLEFLNQMTQEWKNKYILRFVAIAPPFGGAVGSLRTTISGSNFNIPTTTEQQYLESERTQGSVPWLFPQVGGTAWGYDEVMVQTPSKNYTAADWDELLSDINDPIALAIYRANSKLTLTKFQAPLVDTYVLYATGTKTDYKLTYSYDFSATAKVASPSHVESEDGDDTVAARSALRGQEWKAIHTANGFDLQYTEYKGADHVGIIENSKVIAQVVALVTSSTAAEAHKTSPIMMEA